MEGNNMRKIFLLMLGCLGFSSLATAEVNANTGTTPPFNPGYLGRRQALTVQTVTNFAGLFRTPTRYQNNFAFLYEISLKSTLSYQFGYKGYNRGVGNGDWEDYDIHLVEPGTIWSNDKVYQASGEMDFNYKEFTVGVKNYLGAAGATAPYGGYVLANLIMVWRIVRRTICSGGSCIPLRRGIPWRPSGTRVCLRVSCLFPMDLALAT